MIALDDGDEVQDVFTYVVSDGDKSDTATLTIHVSGSNDGPTAENDSHQVKAGMEILTSDGETLVFMGISGDPAAIEGNVLATASHGSDGEGHDVGDVADTDPDDGETLTVVNIDDGDDENEAVAANTTSADGEVVVGEYGTLTIGADGSYSYDLDGENAAVIALSDGSELLDVFTYTVSDGAKSDTATLTIHIDGSGAIITGTPDITGVEDFVFVSDNSGVLIDAEGGQDPYDDSDLVRFDDANDPKWSKFFEGSEKISANIDAMHLASDPDATDDPDDPNDEIQFYFSDSTAVKVYVTSDGAVHQDTIDGSDAPENTVGELTNDLLFWDGAAKTLPGLDANPLLPSGKDLNAVWVGVDGDENPIVVFSTTEDVATDDWKFNDLPFDDGHFGLSSWTNTDLIKWDANAGDDNQGQFSLFFEGAADGHGLDDDNNNLNVELNISALHVIDVALGTFVISLDGTIGSNDGLTLGSVTGIQPGDLILWNGSEFSIVFDGSVAGVDPSIDGSFDQPSDDIFAASVIDINVTTEGGNDVLVGTDGNDILIGLGGADTLTGGSGADTFVYNLVSDSPVNAGDVITDLSGEDTIDIELLLDDIGAGSSFTSIVDPGDSNDAILQIKDGATVVAEITVEGFGANPADVLTQVDDGT